MYTASPVLSAEVREKAKAMSAYSQGERLIRLGNMKAAVRAFEQAVRLAPENKGIRARLAWLLLDQGFAAAAMPHFEYILARRWDDKEALMGLAIAHLKLGNPPETVKILDKAIGFFPDDMVFLKLKGEALLSREETAREAIAVFQQLEKLQPGKAEWAQRQKEAASLAAAYRYGEAVSELKEGNRVAALKALRDVVSLDPHSVGYRTHYAWALLEDGQAHSAAQAFQEVLGQDSRKKEAYVGLALAQLSLGDAPQAMESSRKGLSHFEDDPQLLEILGDAAASRLKTHGIAEKTYRRLLVLQPENHQASIKLARVLIAQGKIDEAEEVFNMLLTTDPLSVEAHRGLAHMNLGSDGYGPAAEHFEKVLAVQPADIEARKGLDQALDGMRCQVQTQGGYLEDSENFQRSHVYTGIRYYLTPELQMHTGYGYLEYDMENNPTAGRNREQQIDRHVIPLLFNYRPSRCLLMEVGGAFSHYSRGGESGAARAATYYQWTPNAGLSLSYAYHDVIDYYGPFQGPWGKHVDDFADRRRYRYMVIDPVAMWSQNIFGASSTQAVTASIRAHETAFWGYQNLFSRLTLSLYGAFGFYSDENRKTTVGGTITYQMLRDPLLKLKYSFFYLDFRHPSTELADLPEWAAPLYWDPTAFKNHAAGVVFEKNLADRMKLAFESDLLFNSGTDRPGFLTLMELDFFLSEDLSLRTVGFYLDNADENNGETSYQIRNIMAGLTYRF
jgi:tetratricopeptide (TPR) repeat protein